MALKTCFCRWNSVAIMSTSWDACNYIISAAILEFTIEKFDPENMTVAVGIFLASLEAEIPLGGSFAPLPYSTNVTKIDFNIRGSITNSDARALCSMLASISVIFCINSNSASHETLVYKLLCFDAKISAMLFSSVQRSTVLLFRLFLTSSHTFLVGSFRKASAMRSRTVFSSSLRAWRIAYW